jgi:hypothetical protein
MICATLTDSSQSNASMESEELVEKVMPALDVDE